jgi:hypothetical protein
VLHKFLLLFGNRIRQSELLLSQSELSTVLVVGAITHHNSVCRQFLGHLGPFSSTKNSSMTYSGDLRWWAMVLIFLYGMDAEMVGDIMGASERTVRRWLEFL